MKKCHVYIPVFLIVASMIVGGVDAQIVFYEGTSEFGLGEHHSGIPMGFGDFNGDMYPDLLVIDETENFSFYLNRGDGKGFITSPLSYASNSVWSIATADLDENGIDEILIGPAVGSKKILYPDFQVNVIEEYDLPSSSFFPQGLYFVDLDRDLDLDVYICNDNAANRIYENRHSQGDFVQSEWIDHTTTPQSDNSGNYAALWSDIDSDGDLDGYISKCRFGVEDATDPRRVNQFFEQRDTLLYQETAVTWGLDLGEQSWAAESGDLDGDGDFDLVVLQHGAPISLLENMGDSFVTRNLNLMPQTVSLPLQVHLADLNNDGLLDIIATGNDPVIWENMGGLEFEGISEFWGQKRMGSSAIADINGDGKLDIYANQSITLNTPASADREDLLWINITEAGNFIRLLLHGQSPNPSSIGAKVELYTGDSKQIREVRSGHSYGVQNEKWLHYGVGDMEEVDSVIVFWPSGNTDRYYDLEVNDAWLIEEGACATRAFDVRSDQGFTLCEGDSIWLWVEDADSVLWSDGSTMDSIQVSEVGIYSAVVWREGCRYVSNTVYLEINPDRPVSLVIESGELINCLGDSVLLHASGIHESYMWNSGQDTSRIWIQEEGQYWVEAFGFCQDWISDSVEIRFVERPDRPSEINDTTTEAGEYVLGVHDGEEGEVKWYGDEYGTELLGEGDSLFVDLPVGDTCFWYSTSTMRPDTTTRLGEIEHEGSSQYSGSSISEGMRFDVLAPCILSEITVFTDFEGWRVLELYDVFLNLRQRDSFFISAPEQTLHLNWELIPGEGYILTTDDEINEQVFGGRSPLLKRTISSFSDFPYTDGLFVSLTGSFNNSPGYYYFYDWKLEAIAPLCESDLASYCVEVDLEVSSDYYIDAGGMEPEVRPIPFGESFSVDIPSSDLVDMRVYSTWGQRVIERISTSDVTVDTREWRPGVYILEVLYPSGKKSRKRIVKSW